MMKYAVPWSVYTNLLVVLSLVLCFGSMHAIHLYITWWWIYVEHLDYISCMN